MLRIRRLPSRRSLSARLFALLLGAAALGTTAQAAPDWEATRLLTLDTAEVNEGQVFHAGVLWTGGSRTEEGYHLAAFTADGRAIGTLRLAHSSYKIQPYGDDSVIVMGKADVNGTLLSFYSVVRRTQTGIQIVEARRWPIDVTVLYFTGKGTQTYFGAPGGSLADDDPGPVGARSILVGTPGSYRFLAPRLPFLGDIMLHDQGTLIAQTGHAILGDFNVYVIDLATEKATRVFNDFYRKSLFDPTKVDDRTIALTERDADQLLLIDVRDLTSRTIPIKAGGPRGLVRFGHCLVTASQESKTLTWVDLRTEEPIFAWDLGEMAGSMRMIRKLSVDPATGTAFVRSAYPMAGGSIDQNGVVMVKDKSGSVAAACKD
jgi:hypothetical protein